MDVAGQRPKSSRAVRVGDTLQVTRGEEVFDVVVLDLSDTRGPAPVARALYAELVERYPDSQHVAAARKRLESLTPRGGS